MAGGFTIQAVYYRPSLRLAQYQIILLGLE